jgi:hypothetical protein
MSNRIIEVVKQGPQGVQGQAGAPGLGQTDAHATDHTAVAAESGYCYLCSAALTITFDAATSLGDGWHCYVRASGGAVTLTADATDTIDGGASVVLGDGSTTFVVCDGGDLYTFASIAGVVEDTTPQAGGPFDMNSNQMRWSKGADVASAGALTLGADGNFFDITGTTSITSIGTLGVGTIVALQFDAALTLTHHATDLILPGARNITTAVGDSAIFVEYASGDWKCLTYTSAKTELAGQSWVSGDTLQHNGTNFVRVAKGAANQVLAMNDAGTGVEWSGGVYHVRDVQTSGTAGGTFTLGAWQTRTLNTVVTAGITGASLASNQITLPAGTYDVYARAPAYQVLLHKAVLYNVTDAADQVVGSNARASSGYDGHTDSIVMGRFTIAGSKVFELRHRCSSNGSFGQATGFGVSEIYSEVIIKQA